MPTYEDVSAFAGVADAGVYRRFAKRAVDLLLIAISLPVVLPLLAIIAAAIAIEGGRPFYVQDRLGRGGRRFRIWKLRTMVVDADSKLESCLAADPALRAEWNATQKLKNDPRITPIGRFIRRTSLDELPQLWNIVKGDMSLVGPRPMLPEQCVLYPGHAYYALRPGLTGNWQVSARNQASFSVRAVYDTEYVREQSFLLDLRIILATFWVVLRGTGY